MYIRWFTKNEFYEIIYEILWEGTNELGKEYITRYEVEWRNNQQRTKTKTNQFISIYGVMEIKFHRI